jgi:hypothetical protein
MVAAVAVSGVAVLVVLLGAYRRGKRMRVEDQKMARVREEMARRSGQ